MSKRLFVGSLAWGTTDQTLKSHFEQAGAVESANVIMDKMSGRSRGFGFVEMTNDEDAEKAIEMLNYTKCDYVMIGRAALGNPFIFEQCNDYHKNEKYKKYSLEEKKEIFFDYYKLLKKYDLLNLGLFKGQALEFFKGYKGSKEVKSKIVVSRDINEIIEIVKSF